MGNQRPLLVVAAAMLLAVGGDALLGQGTKIGFVNSQEILYQTAEGKQGLEQLERYMAQKRQEFESKNNALNDLQQDYQVKRGTLSAEAAEEMELNIEQRQVELRRFQEDIQGDLNSRQEQLLGRISQKVQVVIEEFAKQNAFEVIFMRDQSQAWVSPSLDVTQDIIRLYNERYPGTATAAPSTTPPGQ